MNRPTGRFNQNNFFLLDITKTNSQFPGRELAIYY